MFQNELIDELSFEKQQNIIIGCIYKHPSMTPDDFNSNYLEKLLNKTANIRKPIFLAGDFNFNLLKYGNHNGTTDFLDNLHSHYFPPLIISPTRITSHSATLIDNIFINENDFNISSGNILSSISDHLPQYAFLINFFQTKSKPTN